MPIDPVDTNKVAYDVNRVAPSCQLCTRFAVRAENVLFSVLYKKKEKKKKKMPFVSFKANCMLGRTARIPRLATYPTNPTARLITARSSMDGYQFPNCSAVLNFAWSRKCQPLVSSAAM